MIQAFPFCAPFVSFGPNELGTCYLNTKHIASKYHNYNIMFDEQ